MTPDRLREIAADPRLATYAPGTSIEIVSALPAGSRFTDAVFDFDGTLSTLREGWEAIMEPMMIRAILGESAADRALVEEVTRDVREYIDTTTGVQTLVQMQGLADLVRRYRRVPESAILDAHGYKRLYNDVLLSRVNARMKRMQSGEMSAGDFMMAGGLPLVESLRARGVKLCLASGTDQQDVEREADALGYGPFFAGCIYGATGDVTREAKQIVLERILSAIGEGAVLTFGDGPVEIRETRKRGGYTVGVASDEVRRRGLNVRKRRRLIEAGADIVIPDFCEWETLIALLFSEGPRH